MGTRVKWDDNREVMARGRKDFATMVVLGVLERAPKVPTHNTCVGPLREIN